MPTPTAHDRLFRYVFAEPEHAAGLLRSVLPGEISAQIEWPSLETVPGSVIDPELSEVCVDLLFSVKLDRREAYVYVLLEHQSTSDRTMPFRMLRYMVRIWHKHKALPLPPIVPIVVHHSERGWSAPLTLREMVDAPPELLRFVPAFELVLDDLSAARDEDLRRRTLTDFAALTLFCLARGRSSPDFLGELGRWVRTLLQLLAAENGVQAAGTLVSYIEAVTNAPPGTVREFFRRLGPKGEEAYMTGGEILIQQGLEQGIAQGQAMLLLRLLSFKFGPLPTEIDERVRTATSAELERWAERVLSAATLDAVFEG